MKLTAPSIAAWGQPKIRAIYWAGAGRAVNEAMGCRGCKNGPIRNVLCEAMRAVFEAYSDIPDDFLRELGPIEPDTLTETGRAWYMRGGIEVLDDVLADPVCEDRPRGRRALQRLRRAWELP